MFEDNPCASNPCQTRGYCALSSSNKTYTCVCQENFIGEQCERNNPCLSSPCLNQGLCQANWNRTDTWFTCRCMGTYTGNRCETSLLNPCGGLCMNGYENSLFEMFLWLFQPFLLVEVHVMMECVFVQLNTLEHSADLVNQSFPTSNSSDA